MGLRFLDTRLDGGIPVGQLLVLTAPAHTQSELLLYHLISARPVHYITTTTPDEREIRNAIGTAAVGPPVDLTFTYADPAEFLVAPSDVLDEIRPESFVIVDPIDEIEQAERHQYASFVTTLKRHLHETDSVGVFHALDTPPIPDARRLTLQRADHVWRLEQLVPSREIKTRLLVTKARGGRGPMQNRFHCASATTFESIRAAISRRRMVYPHSICPTPGERDHTEQYVQRGWNRACSGASGVTGG